MFMPALVSLDECESQIDERGIRSDRTTDLRELCLLRDDYLYIVHVISLGNVARYIV